MIRKLSLIIIGGAALVACKQETIVANDAPDPMAEELANAAPVTLPPAIAASKTYRCKDNSLLYVDWYSDGSARVKASQDEAGTQVAAPAEGAKSPLGGDAKSAAISYNGKSCKA
jgi:hypothetical protein